MLGDLRNKPHPIPRITMYTQISSGTFFIPITYNRVRAVIGGTSYLDVHGGSHYRWITVILASYRRVHREFQTGYVFRCPLCNDNFDGPWTTISLTGRRGTVCWSMTT
jgi:hypothetical protein